MAVFSTKDLEYQPKRDKFSYVDTQIKKRFKIKLFTLFLVIFTLILILIGYFLALNYFRIISLSHISPIFDVLPISSYEVKDLVKQNTSQNTDEIISVDKDAFIIEGSIQGFDDENIKIKAKQRTILSFELTLDSNIVNSEDKDNKTTLFPSDLIQKENIGKNVLVDFIKINNKNIITRIEVQP